MDNFEDDQKTKKTSPDGSKNSRKPAKLRVKRIEELQTVASESDKSLVRHTPRANAGRNLITRKIKQEPEETPPSKRKKNTKILDNNKVKLEATCVDNQVPECSKNYKKHNIIETNGSTEKETVSKDQAASLPFDVSMPFQTNLPKTKKKRHRDIRPDKRNSDEIEMFPNDLLELNISESVEDDTEIIYQSKKFSESKVIKTKYKAKKSNEATIEEESLELFDPNKYPPGSEVSLDILFEIDVTVKMRRGRTKKTEEQEEMTILRPKYFKMVDKPGRGVRCVKCNNLIAELSWEKHNLGVHNNLAWRDGDVPVDLSSREQVFRLWAQVIKNKLPLRCHKCGEKKLSVMGFYSHVKVCGKNRNEIEQQKVTCNMCGSRILATSLKSHNTLLHSKPKETEENLIIDESQEKQYRQAANKALKKFKDMDKDRDASLVSYSLESRSSTAPNYYIRSWKGQLSESQCATCFSPGCIYITKTMDDIITHYGECVYAPENVFICKECIYQTSIKKEIIHHIKNVHPSLHNVSVKQDGENHLEYVAPLSEETDDIVMDRIKYFNKRNQNFGGILKYCYKFNFLLKERERGDVHYAFSPVYSWTKQLRMVQYSNLLYPAYLLNLISKWKPVSPENHKAYLPEIKKSIPTSRLLIGKRAIDVRTHQHDWKVFNLFDVEFRRDVVTMFCGGPIRSLAWVPIPNVLNHDQYLAVYCKSNMQSFHKLGQAYSKPGLIQIWNCGVLNNNDVFHQAPVLSLGIAHNFGIIWYMEWCPSGCYQEDARLGLLALAASDGFVYVISVPFPSQLSSGSQPPIYTTKPIFKLHLQDENSKLLGDTAYQVTRLTWSKISGHNVIAAGYTNGMVALWALNGTSPLLKEDVDDVCYLLPYLSFQAHVASVTVIDFANFGEVRWLFTASLDQNSKFWDLYDVKYPITEHKRSIATDGFWFPHWNCGVVCCDDVLTQSLTVSSLVSVRDFGYKPMPLFRTNSACTCIAGNEWLNSVAQGSVAGEWQVSCLTQLFFGLENEKNLRSRRLLAGYTECIDRTKTAEELIEHDKKKLLLAKKDLQEYSKLSEKDVEVLPFLYEDAAIKYGVIFCDFNLDDRSTMAKEAFERPHSAEALKDFPYDMYPIIAMNKMAWNPNENSFKYIAIGYEAGFVRLQCTKFIKSKFDNENGTTEKLD